MHQCRCHVPFMWKVDFEEKIPVLPLRNFCLLYYPGILSWLQHLIIQFPLYYLLVVAYGTLKTKENFKFLALKEVAVAHERWSLARSFQCSDLAEKLLVFWKTAAGRLREVVATGGSTVYILSYLRYNSCTRVPTVHKLGCGGSHISFSLVERVSGHQLGLIAKSIKRQTSPPLTSGPRLTRRTSAHPTS